MPTAPAIAKYYDIMLYLFDRVDSFPRDCKFTLGDRIVTLAFDTLERLLEAAYSKEKTAPLRAANMNIEKLRFSGVSCLSGTTASVC